MAELPLGSDPTLHDLIIELIDVTDIHMDNYLEGWEVMSGRICYTFLW